MKLRVIVLGAGFGGLEISAILSEAIGARLDLTLIDKSDAFCFGFSKLDVMFGHKPADAVMLAYANIVKPGVKFRQETITGIDPVAKRVTTRNGIYDADVLVVALGADYDLTATPGLSEGGNEFYTFQGAERLREVLPGFTKGHAIVGVTSAPFKCPPAPSEAALLLHDYLTNRGVRDACEISIVIPFGVPIPPSPDSSKALLAAFAERNINFIPNKRVQALDPSRQVAILDDGTEMPFDLFLGIPRHRVPAVEKRWLLLRVWVVCLVAGHFALDKGLGAYSEQGPGIGTAYILGILLLFGALIAGSIFVRIRFGVSLAFFMWAAIVAIGIMILNFIIIRIRG